MSECVFCKIAMGEIAARKVMEDDDIVVFYDIRPAAPVHLLVVPKRHIASLDACGDGDQAILGKLMLAAAKAAGKVGLADGFRTVVNVGTIGGQEVFHLHIHVLGGPEPLGRLAG